MDSAIQIKNLSVILGKTYKAIDDITVDISAQQITGFIGPSGAGKTTLIRSIVGRQRITDGEVTILGLAAGSKQLRGQITYMPQQLSVYADLTVTQNLTYFARMSGMHGKSLGNAVDDLLAKVAMKNYAYTLVSRLSGGQKQRVSLAISLIGNPPLVILDEPTVGLDPVLREELWTLLRQLADSGTTIIISSHVMDEAARCDDLLLIRDGKLLAHDTPEKLCQRTNTHNVEQAFITLVGGKK